MNAVFQHERFAGEFRQTTLDEHVEAVRRFLAEREIYQCLHDANPLDLLACTGQPDSLATFVAQQFLKGKDGLPEVVLNTVRNLFGKDFNQPLECGVRDL